MHERREVTYSGRVQGVGFRYTTVQAARGRPVAGFVRNLSDGRVEVVAEGAASDLDGFLGELADRMGALVRSADVTPGPATGEFKGFEVRY